ncbi:MAG: IclR family transcriptional regulator [Phenylobacterium sp.]|uniref:IclR family transcriptional regulator n=1 Tax=Phenylobacterium sp. TaxID=1871053 RepID=UPI00273746BF|nr:IclR family transcriptional regulator [Phenylobacterium sp.]MDP3747393.1 IclR family transcriptional regulator [Phenylobacterium sp.]
MDNNYTLQTVERALSFLEYVAEAPEPPSIRDIAKALDLNITTCYHLLRTLVARGYIERNDSGGLELGDGIDVLARGYRRAQNTEQRLAGIVRRLAASTLETCFLSLKEGDRVVLKVLIEGSQRLRVSGLYVGMKGNEHRRAAGKAVLAHLDGAARAAMLEPSLAQMPDRQRKAMLSALEKELQQTTVRGWSIDEGQSEDGITALGAPVFDASGSVFGAVGVVAPDFRLEKSREAIQASMMSAAAEASELLKEIGDA